MMKKIFKKLVALGLVFMCSAWVSAAVEPMDFQKSKPIGEIVTPLDLPDRH